jgi:pimeloyl-ACP methyl ester carboxylesterase
LIPELVSSGFRVVVPDFVGFGKSDKLTDWRTYSLELHKSTVEHLLRHLNLLPDSYHHYHSNNLTLVGHNWGSMLGSSLIKDHPDWFSRLVILNTNNLPDGEVDRKRFVRNSDFQKFLIFDSAFLAFHSLLDLMKYSFPFSIMFQLFNTQYNRQDLEGFSAPFKRRIDLVGFKIALYHDLKIEIIFVGT